MGELSFLAVLMLAISWRASVRTIRLSDLIRGLRAQYTVIMGMAAVVDGYPA